MQCHCNAIAIASYVPAVLIGSPLNQNPLPGAGAQHQAGATQLQEPACIGSAIDSNGVIAAVVILAYNRADYLQQCITSVLERHGQEPTNRWAPGFQALLYFACPIGAQLSLTDTLHHQKCIATWDMQI